tara:strand:- start:66729 stop:68006 length:1278 start_codon:yes stop_codon:yes gene_type:complete
MAKAVITNRIYLDSNIEVERNLLTELTYKIPAYRPELPPKIITTARVVNDRLITIPSGRMDLIPEGYEIHDRRVEVPAEFPEFKFELRASQKLVHDAVNSDCFINAFTSWGKTFTGLAIAAKLGMKTLIIVHTLALRDQWAEEVRKVFGFEPSIYGSGSKDTSALITIGNIQSLTRAKRGTFDKMFGLILVDECHHIPSTTFSNLVDRSHAKYKIGLSASDRRKDGLHILFQDYFSPKTFKPPKENYMVPSVHRISIPIRFQDYGAWHERLSALDHDDEYHKMLAMIARSYATKGHKVLVLSSRTNILAQASKYDNSSLVIDGDTKERKAILDEVLHGKDYHTLYGSSNIFAEGVSANKFSCLVLGTPMNNEPLLEQFIGRVIRESPDKLSPIIVDPQLIGHTVQNQQQLRLGYYLRMGYKVTNI